MFSYPEPGDIPYAGELRLLRFSKNFDIFIELQITHCINIVSYISKNVNKFSSFSNVLY